MRNDTAVVTEINGNQLHDGEDVSDKNIVSDKPNEKVKTPAEVKRLEVNPKYKLLWPTPRLVEQLEGKELLLIRDDITEVGNSGFTKEMHRKQGQTVHKRRRCIEKQKYNLSIKDSKETLNKYKILKK